MSTRGTFIAGTTALVVVAAAAGGVRSFAVAADAPAKMTTLGDWLRMLPDGTVEMYTDKVEVGMGVPTGFAQFVADDLDVSFDRVRPILGDTSDTVAAGGVGGSFSTYRGNFPIRNAAAEMRRVLLAAAALQLGVPVTQLSVNDGVIHVASDATKTLRYTDVLGALTSVPKFPQTGDGFSVDLTVPAKPKDWADYRIAGSSLPRKDAAGKAFGRYPYVTSVKPAGMVHGRFVYPPSIGATLVSVDESSIHGIGDARVIRVAGFAGVVATREWDAVRAARALKTTWTQPAVTLPAQAKLADFMWAQPAIKESTVKNGDVDATIGNAPLEASYFWPFQSHANMGPGCSVVDVRDDGVTVWSGTQKTHALRQGISKLLNRPPEGIRVVWLSDAGSYGRAGLEESAAAAAFLSRAIGRPVRVQSMRADNTQWGTKSPAMTARLRGNVQNGGIVAFDAVIRQFNGNEIFSQPSVAGSFLAGQMAGFPNDAVVYEFGQYGESTAKYEIPNVRSTAALIAPFAPGNSPLRTSHMRDPEGPGTTFIVESFVDELAARAGVDAIAFRIHHLKVPRHIEALQTVAKASGWDTRPSASSKRVGANGELIGRGVAFATRIETIVATVAEVGVNPKTGAVRVRRIICAHDCGFIVNPKALQGTIEANLIQSISRTIYEEATFNDHTVTSSDWVSYPIAHMRDIPDEVKVVMISRPTIAPGGAGEPSSRPVAAAIANAVFDATGVRVRTAPLTPKNVLAAMHAQGKIT
jgi:CO/xanthine dehydrogenase Mo-binding subunit